MRVGGRIFALALLSLTSIFSNTHVNAAIFAYPSNWMRQPKPLTNTLERVEPEKNLPLTHHLDVQKQKGSHLAPLIFLCLIQTFFSSRKISTSKTGND